MSDEGTANETCIVCGKSTEGVAGVAHLYHGSRRFAVCCPMCMEMFQRAPDRFASGEHRQSLLEELIEKMKWEKPGRW